MGEFAIICPDHCTKHHSSLPSPFTMRCQRAMFSTVQSPIGPPHTHTNSRPSLGPLRFTASLKTPPTTQ